MTINSKNKYISVIIPAYNEEKYINACILSLIKQSVTPKELIFVDDGSVDNTVRIVKELKSKYSAIQIILHKHQGPAKARNLGAKRSRGSILVFLDADMTYERNYIKEITKPIVKGKEIAVFTTSEFVGNLNNIWSKIWDETTFGNSGKRVKGTAGSRQDAFRAIKRTSFLKVGGYSDKGYSDDSSVLNKLGKRAIGTDKALCYHYNPETIREVFESARWIGRDTNNYKNYSLFLVFFPPWTLLKAVVDLIKFNNLNRFIFRLIYDLGYFLGLIDANLMEIHYK